MKFVFGEDERILEWMRQFFVLPGLPTVTIGVAKDDGELIAGIGLSGFRLRPDQSVIDLELSFCASRPIWGRPHMLRGLFAGCLFGQYNCARVSARVDATNHKALRVFSRLGFRPEGVIRRGGNGCDAIMLGMLRDECPWLPERTAA